MNPPDFSTALLSGRADQLAAVPKSDLHNHAMLGSRFEKLCEFNGTFLPLPPLFFHTFTDFENYLDGLLRNVIKKELFFETMLRNTFLQAKQDSIQVLQISIDCRLLNMFNSKAGLLTETIEKLRLEIIPDVHFIPQIGVDRKYDFSCSQREAEALLETTYFKSVDLYGDELFGDNSRFVPFYRKAQQQGLFLCAHAGEYGTAEDVRKAVDMFELNQVQHGISAATSQEVMRWLERHKIIVNVCPQSNLALCRVPSIKKHPIRILFDQGIVVTLNTDDLMIFNHSVSEEYESLYHSGLFSVPELEVIRQNGLNSY